MGMSGCQIDFGTRAPTTTGYSGGTSTDVPRISIAVPTADARNGAALVVSAGNQGDCPASIFQREEKPLEPDAQWVQTITEDSIERSTIVPSDPVIRRTEILTTIFNCEPTGGSNHEAFLRHENFNERFNFQPLVGTRA